jgi:hypothetical protein
LSRLATPPHAINPDMSQVIDDATSINTTHDDASTLLDDGVPLGDFLDEQIARAKKNEITETDEIIETDQILETENLETPIRPSPSRYEMPKIPEGYVMDEETTRDFLACNDRDDLKKLLCKLKEKSLNARMKYDPKFATSPIFATDATHDDASTLLDDGVPLGDFLDEQIARAKENEITKTDEIIETNEIPETENLETPIRPSSPRYELPKIPEGYVMDEETASDFLACNDRDDLKKLLCKLKEKIFEC